MVLLGRLPTSLLIVRDARLGLEGGEYCVSAVWHSNDGNFPWIGL